MNNFLTKSKDILLRRRDQYAIPPMDGPLLPNNMLDKFNVLTDSLKDPDDLTFDLDGNLYVSTENRIMRLSGRGYEDMRVFAEFESQTGGLRFHRDGRLMVCVSGKGLAMVNKEGKKLTWIDSINGQSISCLLSGIAGPAGKIYLTDGTTHHEPQKWFFDLMEKRKAGRLIEHDQDTSRSKILLSGLSYPYGLETSHDGKWLLLSESWSHTLSRYPLEDIREATREVLIPNLPGYPGRIIRSVEGGYWMSLFSMRTHLVEFVLGENKYRKKMMQTIDPAYWIRPTLSSGKDFLEPLQAAHAITLGIMKPWSPPRSYGLVVKLDEDFEIVKSLHCRVGGNRHGITGLAEKDGELTLTSKGGHFILQSNLEALQW